MDIRPIDANELAKEIDGWSNRLNPGFYRSDLIVRDALVCVQDYIAEASTLDYAPVRHGKWIEPDYVYFGAKQYVCNQCKDDEFWADRYTNVKDNYCPNCGALMDGKENAHV